MAYIKALPSVLSKTADYTVSTNDGDNVHVNVSASGGAATITFYAASGNTGKIITVKKTDSSANAVTLDGNASETLDGALTLTLSAQNDAVTLVCNGTNWIKASAVGAGAIPIAGMAANDDIYATSATQLGVGARQLRQTFRGLTLRTHPDADVAASKVYLDHADEIVLHDGTRVADWDDLVADITASGAGGLDTGSEGASRWYEIHAIRKSSDGTKNLLLHRAKNYGLDQSQTTMTSPSATRYSGTQLESANTFTAGLTGSVPFVDLGIAKVGSPTGQVWAEIRATSGGVPTGAALYTSDKIDVSLLSTTAMWARFVFRTQPSLTASTVYAVVLNGDWTTSSANYVSFYYASSLYANGAAYNYNNTSWASIGGGGVLDFAFRIYVTQNDTAVTMPSGYDQRCLIGWVYNGSGSNFSAFLQQDRSVRRGYSAIATGATATIATLVDVSAIVPPVPVVMTGWEMFNNTQNKTIYLVPDLNGSGSNTGAIVYTQQVAATYGADFMAELMVTFQHFYYSGNGGTYEFYNTGWQW